jgi:hypothetical protein
MSTKKGGPNFTISTIPSFGGHPLQIFWPNITQEAQANLPNVPAKKRSKCWHILMPTQNPLRYLKIKVCRQAYNRTETTLGSPFRKIHPKRGGVDIKWNGPSSLVNKSELWQISDIWSLSFANFSRQATNLFRRFSVTFRSDCETSSKLIQHLFNFNSLFQPPSKFYTRVAAMLPWKHARFQDGVNETLISVLPFSRKFPFLRKF